MNSIFHQRGRLSNSRSPYVISPPPSDRVVPRVKAHHPAVSVFKIPAAICNIGFVHVRSMLVVVSTHWKIEKSETRAHKATHSMENLISRPCPAFWVSFLVHFSFFSRLSDKMHSTVLYQYTDSLFECAQGPHWIVDIMIVWSGPSGRKRCLISDLTEFQRCICNLRIVKIKSDQEGATNQGGNLSPAGRKQVRWCPI